MDFVRNSRTKAGIDMTPLVDIVFQLMIFFMLTTSFVPSQSLELLLPSLGGEVSKTKEDMRIQVTSSGHVTVDGVAVGRSALEDNILLRVAKNQDVRIGIYSTPGVSVQQLITVMDMVYAAGGRHVQVDRMEYGGAS
jgi:biopolymer transport protein ExbD